MTVTRREPETTARTNSGSTRKRSLLSSFWLPLAGSVMDISAVIAAAEGAFLLRFWGPINDLYPAVMIPTRGDYVWFGLVLGLTYVVTGWAYHHYATEVSVPLDREIARILRGAIFAMGLVMAAIFFYREFSYSRLTFLLTLALMIPLLVVARAVYQRMRRSLFKRGIGVLRIAVWGAARKPSDFG
ncbi:MAG: hypothetical protein IPK53_01250 [bacterium]|nr:hypothetical protein [bacterium]